MYALRLTKGCFLRRHVIIAIGLAAACRTAAAQQPLQMPAPELSTPGVEQSRRLPFLPLAAPHLTVCAAPKR
jgi:hypothetical protein